MQHVSADEVRNLLSFDRLIPALESAFQDRVDCPHRAHHYLHERSDEDDKAELMMMPAWDRDWLGVKLVTAFPANARQGVPTLAGLFVLFDATTGLPVMTIDGAELTIRRTAAVSAIATRCLARTDASTLLMIGAGRQFPTHLEAQCQVRDIRRVLVWARDTAKARAAIERVPAALAKKLDFHIAPQIEDAVKEADIICSAIHSTVPLLAGAWIRHGTHVDVTGAYRPDMREVDAALLARAAIYVDTREGAVSEDGDIMAGLEKGVIEPKAIRGEIGDLLRLGAAARENVSDVTLFKAVGAGFEDLATARLIHQLTRK